MPRAASSAWARGSGLAEFMASITFAGGREASRYRQLSPLHYSTAAPARQGLSRFLLQGPSSRAVAFFRISLSYFADGKSHFAARDPLLHRLALGGYPS